MSFRPRTATVRLYQGDYQQRVAELEQIVDEAQSALDRARKQKPTGPRLMHETAPDLAGLEADVDRAVVALGALRDEAEAGGDVLAVTMRALPRRKWADLVKAHPPRDGDDVPEENRKSDAQLGINDETFGDALVPPSIESLSDPDLSVDDLLDAVSSAQFDQLYGTAFALNRAVGSDPKGPPRLPPSPSSNGTGN